MIRHKRRVFLIFLVGLLLVLPAKEARAEWIEDGAAICTATGDQPYPTVIPDGSGGAIIIWADQRSGDYDIYAQRVNSSGDTLWTGDGVALCTAGGDQQYPRIILDGSGGAIATWRDRRSGNDDIYAQRVDSSGSALWTVDGVALCTASVHQTYPRIISDGAGGAIVTWQDKRAASDYDIYAQRIDASGVVQWTADGVALCTAAEDQDHPRIVSDGASGAVVVWRDERSGFADRSIYSQRVNASGLVQWTADGVSICAGTGHQTILEIASDGAGGAIVTWEDSRSGYSDIYAQRVDASGVAQWTADGVALCTAADTQYWPQIVSDGSGGAIVAWHDSRNLIDEDVYAQRVDANGVVQWTTDGVALSTGPGDQIDTGIASDGSGGAIVALLDWRGDSADIYAQRVNASGITLWKTDGVALCTATGFQWEAEIASDGAGGAILTWHDERSGAGSDVYAQRVTSTGNLGSHVLPLSASAIILMVIALVLVGLAALRLKIAV